MTSKLKIGLFVLITFLFFINTFSQKKVNIKKLRSKFVLEKNQTEYYKNIILNIFTTFKTKINKETAIKWKQALNDAESLFLNDNRIIKGIHKSLNQEPDKYIKLQHATLSISYSIDINIFSKSIYKIFISTTDKVSYAIATNYLLRANYLQKGNNFYLNNLKSKFRNWKKNSILKNLYFDLTNPNKFKSLPPLTELLQHPFQKGTTIIYSLHRKNRNFPGLTIIKKPDGTFVKNNDGTIFSIPQLAISFSNLPDYIPNGNTPEGIYSIIGTYISPTKTIGPTPNVLTRSPFEVLPKIFFHKKNKYKKFSKEDYKNLLPSSWQNYFPIYQSFYAGKSGRKLIIMHGSTDDLEYYKQQSYYPMSPTRGCLSSKEIWDEETGKCLESDQAKLINSFYSTKKLKGFLVVIEIDDKNAAVTIEDIKKWLH